MRTQGENSILFMAGNSSNHRTLKLAMECYVGVFKPTIVRNVKVNALSLRVS